MNTVSELIRTYRHNPIRFVREQFKIDPDPWQKSFLSDFSDPKKQRIALKACVGPGKSAALAWAGWNFLLCYGGPGEHPKGGTVSITEDNLKINLWAEYYKWQQISPLLSRLFVHTREKIFAKDHPGDWFIAARAFPQKADKATLGRTLSGIHSPYMLFTLDETGEMPPEILQAAEQAMSTGKWHKIIQAGNPMSLDGALFKTCIEQASEWTGETGSTITITGDPDDPNRSSRIDINWAKKQIQLYGRDNPWIMYSILGKFPPSSVTTLIGQEEVMESMRRYVRPETVETNDRRYGIDVARFGDDRTVITKRQGLLCHPQIVKRNARTNEIADIVNYDDADWASDLMAIDDTGGYGAGVIDQLLLLGKSPLGVNFGSKALDELHYYDRRSEMWWNMAQWIKRGGQLPNDPDLAKEIPRVTYIIQNGKIRLEQKSQMKSRTGVSPDMADSLALTFAVPEARRRRGSGIGNGKAEMEYDVLTGGKDGIQPRDDD